MKIQFLQGLSGFRRENLVSEVLAGVTLAALMIPLNIGYAQVAGLPPTVGLYAAILPMIAFALCCSSQQLVSSPDASSTAMLGSQLVGLAALSDPRYVQLAYANSMVCAAIFFLFWYFKLGFLANFLSKAVLVGFISGLGIEIFTSQVKKILSIGPLKAEGWFREMFELITRIGEANLYTVAIGLGTIVIIRLLKRFAPKIPGALVALVLMTLLVAGMNLSQHGVSILGEVPAGLPSLTVPQVSISDYGKLLPGALAICGITLAEGLLVGRSYAQKGGYPFDSDQEMFAFGAANVAAGLSGGLVMGSSASRTAAMDDTGSRSQVPSLVAAVVVSIVLLFFTNLLALLPKAALAGIVANAVLSLIETEELKELFHLRRSEFWIAVVCLLSVLVLGPLEAVIIAFLMSVIDVVRRASSPSTAVLTEVEGEGRFVSTTRYPDAAPIPGLLVYRFSAPLFFANSAFFREQVEELVETTHPPAQWFVLNAEAISDIDVTGAATLKQVITFLDQKGIRFAMSRVSHSLHRLLETYELLETIGKQQIYSTNRKAAAAFRAQQQLGSHPIES